MSEKRNDEVIDELLADFESQRNSLKDMITDVEKLKEEISSLFPNKLDARYKRLFEEKVKTAVALLNVLLDVRKELIKTMKDEIEIRRKVKGKGDGDTIDDILDVRDMAKKIEKLNKKTVKVTKVVEKKKEKIKKDPPVKLVEKRELSIPKPDDETVKDALNELKSERSVNVR